MLPAEAKRCCFAVEEFHRMGEAGLPGEDDQVAREGQMLRRSVYLSDRSSSMSRSSTACMPSGQ